MAFFPIGSYQPDRPEYQSGVAKTIKNVWASSKQGQSVIFKPFYELSSYSSALTGQCLGARSFLTSGKTVKVFAGDATSLNLLDVSSTSFSDVSKAGGYSTSSTDFWNFTRFGDTVIATNYADPIQEYTFGTSTLFADLSAAAPKAKHVNVVKEWLVVGNTEDATNGTKQQRVWWSAVGDPTNWPTPGSATAAQVQSGNQDISGDHGVLQGITSGLASAEAAIFFEKAIYRMSFTGDQYTFGFDVAEGTRGTPASQSIVQIGSLVYYLGEDGFYVFDGQTSTSIGTDKIDQTFFDDLDNSYLDKVIGSFDPVNKVVYWAYHGSANSGVYNKILAYNWSIGEWTYIEQECEYILPSSAFGYTLEALDGISSSLDDLPYSLDSRAWTGGVSLLTFFDTSHKLAYQGNTQLIPLLETPLIDSGDGRKLRVKSVRPIYEGDGNAKVATKHKNTINGISTTSPFVEVNSNGKCSQRINSRYLRSVISFDADQQWDQVVGVEIDMVAGGKR